MIGLASKQVIFEPRHDKTVILLMLRYMVTSYIRDFKLLTIFCGCTVRLVSDLVGNHEDMFSRDELIYV